MLRPSGHQFRKHDGDVLALATAFVTSVACSSPHRKDAALLLWLNLLARRPGDLADTVFLIIRLPTDFI
jgi:hypothetical protein